MNCGGQCRCAQNATKMASCPTPSDGKMVLDKEGKCPCGKPETACCHANVVRENLVSHSVGSGAMSGDKDTARE